MKEDIIKNLIAVINTLNVVSVSGKTNLNNLSGSISVLENTIETLNSLNIEPTSLDIDKKG